VSRLFFALWPTDSMQSALADATREAVAACGGKPVPIRNYHFTLAFLGDVRENRLADLSASAQRAAPSTPLTISLTLDEITYWRRSQLLCATSTADASAATSLADALKRALVATGFTPDLDQPFRPHVTLARKARTPVRKTPLRPLTFTFSDFALVASQPGPQSSTYTIISRYPHP
jgi:2'-5' RNA ligase